VLLKAQKLRSPCFRACVRLCLAAPESRQNGCGITGAAVREQRRQRLTVSTASIKAGVGKVFLPSSPRMFASILRVPDGEEGEGCALPGIKAVGIVSGLMEAEAARPTVALNASNPCHYGQQKHS
jgi:hypothetical protein